MASNVIEAPRKLRGTPEGDIRPVETREKPLKDDVAAKARDNEVREREQQSREEDRQRNKEVDAALDNGQVHLKGRDLEVAIAAEQAREEDEKITKERALAQLRTRNIIFKMLGIDPAKDVNPTLEKQINKVVDVVADEKPTVKDLASVIVEVVPAKNSTEQEEAAGKVLSQVLIKKAEVTDGVTREELATEIKQTAKSDVKEEKVEAALAVVSRTTEQELAHIELSDPLKTYDILADAQSHLQGIESVSEPVDIVSMESERRPSVNESRILAEASEVARLAEMKMKVEAVLVHFAPEDPLRVQAERVLHSLNEGVLQTATPEQLAEYVIGLRFAEVAELSPQQRELTSAVRDIIDDVAETNGITQEVIKAQLVTAEAEPIVDTLTPEPLHFTPGDTDSKATTLDEGLRARRSETERLSKVDWDLQAKIGTSEEKEERLKKAAKTIGVDREIMTTQLENAVQDAHEIGLNEYTADGVKRGGVLGKYTIDQIQRKYEALYLPIAKALGVENTIERATPEGVAARHLVREKIKSLMDQGIVGVSDETTAGAGPDRVAVEGEGVPGGDRGTEGYRPTPEPARERMEEPRLITDPDDPEARRAPYDVAAFDRERERARRVAERMARGEYEDIPDSEREVPVKRLIRGMISHALRNVPPEPSATDYKADGTLTVEGQRKQHERRVYVDQLNVNIRQLEAYINNLGGYVGRIDRLDAERFAQYQQRIREIDRITNVNERQNALVQLAEDIMPHYADAESKEGRRAKITSLEQLVEIIMAAESDEFQTGREFELINEKGEVVPEHFLAWVRTRMIYFHEIMSDSAVNFENEVSIPLEFRTLTLREIINTPQYFRQRIKTVDSEGNIVYRTETNDAYEKLREQINYEQWLFGVDHNNDAEYRLARGDLDALDKFIAKAYYFNQWTATRSRLRRILHLPGIDKEYDKLNSKALHEMMHLAGEQLTTPGKVGRAFRRAELAYQFLPDKEMLENILNNDLKGRNGMETFYQSTINSAFSRYIDAYNSDREREKFMDISRLSDRQKQALFDFLHNKKGITRDEFDRMIANDEERKAYFEQDDIRNLLREHNETKDKERIAHLFFEGELSDQQKQGIFEIIRSSTAITREEFNHMFGHGKDLEKFALLAMHWRFKQSGATDWAGLKNKIFDAEDTDNIMAFQVFNFFNDKKADGNLREAVRSALRAGVAHAEGHQRHASVEGDTYEEKRRRAYAYKRDQLDMKYADAWAYSNLSWTGVAAGHDTEAIAFDKWAEIQSTRESRIRSMIKGKPYGFAETINGLERLGFNFWQVAKVKQGGRGQFDRTIQEVLLGIEYDDVQKGGNDLAKIKLNLNWDEDDIGDTNKKLRENLDFDFEPETMESFYSEQFAKAKKLLKILNTSGMHLDEIFKWDAQLNSWTYDASKADQSIKADLWDAIRYIYNTAAIPMNHNVRTWYKIGINPDTKEAYKKRKLQFGTRTIEEAMMSEEVRNMNMYHRDIFHADYAKGERGRNVIAYLLKGEIKHYRKWYSGKKRWGLHEISAIRDFFTHHWAVGQKTKINSEGNEEIVEDEFFFDHHEWEDSIAEPIGAGSNRLQLLAHAASQADSIFGGLGGFLKNLGKEFANTFK